MIEYENTSGYQPGVCNIGPAEIQRRRQVGFLGMAAAVGIGAALLAVDAPAFTRLVVALPVAVGLGGFIQARERFCAGFGMAGVQNMDELGSQIAVEAEEARNADRRKAWRIHAMSMAGGLAAGVAFALLPV